MRSWMRPWFVMGALALLIDSSSAWAGRIPDDYAEYTVTAWRSPREIRKTGLSVTVITAEEIRASGRKNVHEILRDVPGLRVVQTGSFGGVTSIFTRGGESTFNLILIDGVQVNPPNFGYDWSHLATENIERIEIIRGPASVVYGGDAASAVIQIFTRRGDGAPRHTLFGEGGSYGTSHGGFSASGQTGTVRWSTALTQFNTEGHLPINNDYGRTSLSGRVDLPVSDVTDVSVTINHVDFTTKFPTDNGGDMLAPFIDDPDQSSRGVQTALGATVTREMTERWTLALDLGQFRSTAFNRDPDNGAAADPFGAFFGKDEFQRRTVGLRSEHRLGKWLLGLGGEYEGEEAHGVNSWAVTHFSRTNSAGHLSLVGDITDALSVSAGIRMDDNSRLAREVSSRGSVAYKIASTGTVLRVAGGDGFRNPDISHLVASFATFRPNPNLKGEQERAWEAGFDQPFAKGRVTLSTTFFDARTRGVIGTVAQGGFLVPQNVGNIDREGVELGLKWRIHPRWTATGHYTWLRTRVSRVTSLPATTFLYGNPAIRRPKHSGGATISYSGERFRTSVNVNAVGDYIDQDFSGFDLWDFTVRRRRAPGYAKVDLAAEYDLTKDLTMTAHGTNILDKGIQEVYGFSSPGAAWHGGLRWTF